MFSGGVSSGMAPVPITQLVRPPTISSTRSIAAIDPLRIVAGHHAGVEVHADLHVRMRARDALDEGGLVGLHVAGQVVRAGGEDVVEDRDRCCRP